MKKNIKYLLILPLFVLTAALFMFLHAYTNRIPSNPPGTIGNTAGNLNNGGLICEQDGRVYFSNPTDENSLYSMTVDETDLTKLYSGNIGNILAGGDYLYYFMREPGSDTSLDKIRISHSFYRSDTNGKKVETMTPDVVIQAQLVNDSLYLLTSNKNGVSFQKMNTDRSGKTLLADYAVYPACALDGKIYYNGTTTNHYLYALDTTTDVQDVIWKGNVWYPVLDNHYFYYLDVEHNYRLCRYDSIHDVVEVLTNDRVDCFNIGSGYIYYQCNSQTEPALKRMQLNGSDATIIAEGNYTAIHMTSKYVYFKEIGKENIWYHSIIGSDTYSSM